MVQRRHPPLNKTNKLVIIPILLSKVRRQGVCVRVCACVCCLVRRLFVYPEIRQVASSLACAGR